jgi:hypothetical protein
VSPSTFDSPRYKRNALVLGNMANTYDRTSRSTPFPCADDALRRAELLIESGAREMRIKDDAGTLFTVEDLAKAVPDVQAARASECFPP